MKNIKDKKHFNLISNDEIQLEHYKELLDKEILYHQVKFETKDIPVSPYPYLVSTEVNASLEQKCKILHRIVDKVVSQYRSDPKIQKYMNLHQKFHELVMKSTSGSPAVMFCRFDFCLVNGQMKLYEVNSACPAGLQISKGVYSANASSEIINDLNINHNLALKAFPVNIDNTFTNLVRAATGSKMRHTDPSLSVGLLNSKHNTMINELDSFKNELTSQGINCEIGFVEDVKYINGNVYVNQKKVNACYQKFDNDVHSCDYETAFSKKREDVIDYIKAIEDDAVIQINPFNSMFVGESKTLLALIKDPCFSYLFNDVELKVIEDVVSGTEKLTENNRKMTISMKDDWVLKKSLDTRGRNVTLGSECSHEDWKSKIEAAVADTTDYVIQQCHVAEKSESKRGFFYTTQAMFMVAGEPIGMISRTSQNKVTNVGKEGFVQLTLLY